jgi:hypothetical protein
MTMPLANMQYKALVQHSLAAFFSSVHVSCHDFRPSDIYGYARRDDAYTFVLVPDHAHEHFSYSTDDRVCFRSENVVTVARITNTTGNRPQV